MEIVKSLQSQRVIKYFLIVIFGSILLTISAKIKIPFYPVPMTMQTFVVLLMGITLGWKISVAIISLYLFEGAIGLPVFAGTPEKGIGFVYFSGPTMGYLVGFLIATYCAGSFRYDKGLVNTFFKLIFSVSFIYIFGLLWLGFLIGWDKPIFELGAQPFLLAELFKILLATFTINQIKKIKKIF